MQVDLDRSIPRWAVPLTNPRRFLGAVGGRSSGKSHFFAEQAVEQMVVNPNLRFLCLREIQRSLKFSAKHLIERKIEQLGVSSLFDIRREEILRVGGQGLFAFAGMQDHTADSIKSFEDFHRAWFEEAHRMSKRSMGILIPTIRSPGSQLWFSWNREHPTDPVEVLFESLAEEGKDNFALAETNYKLNPFCPQESKDEAARMARLDPEDYAHIWLGKYMQRSEAQIFGGRWKIDEFEPGPSWDGPYHGLDFGFKDPMAATRCWIHNNRLFIEYEAFSSEIDLDETAEFLEKHIPGIAGYELPADNSRPESISYLRRNGLPRIVAVEKWPGSVEDGIDHIKTYDEVVIHPRCVHMIEEARLYRFKVDKRSGQVLDSIEDKHNHGWDSIRYGLQKVIKQDEFLVASA